MRSTGGASNGGDLDDDHHHHPVGGHSAHRRAQVVGQMFSLFPSLIVALSLAAATPELIQATAPLAAEPAIALDVPYLPQTEAMCAGRRRRWCFATGAMRMPAAAVRRVRRSARGRDCHDHARRGRRTSGNGGRFGPRHRSTRSATSCARGVPSSCCSRIDRIATNYVVIIGADADRFVVHDPRVGTVAASDGAGADASLQAAGNSGRWSSCHRRTVFPPLVK